MMASCNLVPQKRSLDQGELSDYLESKVQRFSGHTKNFPCSESFFTRQSMAAQEDVSGVCEARRRSASGIGSVTGINEEEAIENYKRESENQAYPRLSSPLPVEVCYGCVCGTIPRHSSDD